MTPMGSSSSVCGNFEEIFAKVYFETISKITGFMMNTDLRTNTLTILSFPLADCGLFE